MKLPNGRKNTNGTRLNKRITFFFFKGFKIFNPRVLPHEVCLGCYLRARKQANEEDLQVYSCTEP
eukprot:m.31937 g.31937  ORF g.31937 m.31937 type:complete len:65 (+) comp6346_c0_seq1:80-274(+)